MKKLTFLFFLNVLFASSFFAQINCEVTGDNATEDTMEKKLLPADCLAEVSFDDHELTSPFTIYVNVHFYPDAQGNIFDVQTGIQYANDVINRANMDLANLDQNQIPGPNGLAPHVLSSKYQYVLYTEADNPNDPHGGIWFHPDQTSVAGVYNSRVIDIKFDETANCGNGVSCTGCDVRIKKYMGCHYSNQARLLNHEMAHSLSLDHPTWCNNQCSIGSTSPRPANTNYTPDINPQAECDPNCPDQRKCEGGSVGNPDSILCNALDTTWIKVCTYDTGNNLTSQANYPKALTPCQWETVFKRILAVNTLKYSWANNCTEVAPDWHITSGSNVIWDRLKLINRNIIIESGATLTITCEVKMAEGLNFIVRRGGKLIVDDGKITNLCPDTYWGTIFVEGNNALAQPDPFGTSAANDAGVVLVMNNSLIEYSRAVTRTEKFNSQGSSAYWGGLVHFQDSEFRNNKVVSGFMKYDFPNQSKFINCILDGGAEGSYGLTVWDTDGITLNNCEVMNMSNHGIYSINSGLIVKDGNNFHDNDIAIGIRSTHPFTSYYEIGEVTSATNTFKNNQYHINSYATNDASGLKIFNNDFSNSYIAINLRGDSKFFINDNTFDENSGAIYLHQTAGDFDYNAFNYIKRNYITASVAGISAIGANRELQFLCNIFSCPTDFHLEGIDGTGTLGSIAKSQGNSFYPARNCFTRPLQTADIDAVGNTSFFRYYVSQSPGDFCSMPFTPGNYGTYSSSTNFCPTEGEGLVGGGGNEAEKAANIKLDMPINTEEMRRNALDEEVRNLIASNDFSRAIQLLDQDKSNSSQLSKFGLYLNIGEYNKAETTLNSINLETEEFEDFKRIQFINMNRMKKLFNYELMTKDSLFLERIALSSSGNSAYARTLLEILADRRFRDLMELGNVTIQENHDQAKIEFIKPTVTVYPNPAKEEINISFKELQATHVEVSSILGQSIYQEKVDKYSSSMKIMTKDWANGIYIIQLFDQEGKPVHTEKVVIEN